MLDSGIRKTVYEMLTKQIKIEKMGLFARRGNGWEKRELLDYYTGVCNTLEDLLNGFYESNYFTQFEHEQLEKAIDNLREQIWKS